MSTFRACPFCGCDHPDNTLDNPAFPDIRGEGTQRELHGYIVRCGNPGCAAEMRGEYAREALEKWNRRVSQLIARAHEPD